MRFSRRTVVHAGLKLAVALLATAVVSGAQAGLIPVNTFLEFGFSGAGIPATGCDPADPAGPFCIPSSGTPTSFLDAPPWTFSTATASTLIVTDAFQSGERFEVFDFGASLGLTSAPGLSDCSDDPVACLADPAMSQAAFLLAAGNHSLTLAPTLSPGGGGAGYLFVAVPEPGQQYGELLRRARRQESQAGPSAGAN